MFGARWKWNASRALAVPRFPGGSKVPPPIQRMRADDLLAAVFPDQVACAENLDGEIRIPGSSAGERNHRQLSARGDGCGWADRDSAAAWTKGRCAPWRSIRRNRRFSRHEILNANPYAFLDDAPLEERRTRAVQLRRGLPPADANGIGALDPAAIAEVSEAIVAGGSRCR